MKNLLLPITVIIFSFLFIFSSKQAEAQCTHTFNMYDSYGDGWNGASVDVLVNGSVVVNGATIPFWQFSSYSEPFTANTGDFISLGPSWVSGSWNSEISWDIKDGNGTLIASGGTMSNGGGYGLSGNSTGNCLAIPPPSPSSFCDDFESYNVNDPIAETSSNWNSWDELENGAVAPFIDDVNINNTQSNSGSNSIYFNGTSNPGGPSDVILPFGSTAPYTSGYFNFSANFYVNASTGAYFNFQAENTPGVTWSLDVKMDLGTIVLENTGAGINYLTSSYPEGVWFLLEISVDLTTNNWELFIDGVTQGSFTNTVVNKIASLDLYPLSGHQFYVDDVCYEFSLTPIITIYGCTDSTALNYSPLATIDDGSCSYCITGCTDSLAINYDPLAACDDGSCSYCNIPLASGISDTVYKCDSLLTITANIGYTYLWSTGETTQTINVNSEGNYWLIISDAFCSFTDTFYVYDYFTSFSSGFYTMGFEANEDFSGWSIEDANNDGYGWNQNAVSGFNGGGAMLYNYNPDTITSADDWMFSQCFMLDSAVTYYVSFLSRVASESFPEDMSVFIGNTQVSTFMNTQLMQLNNMTNVIYDSSGALFSVPISGIYYLGWHAQSSANSWRIELDNINVGLFVQQLGCMDTLASNYNPSANQSDSSCIYTGCTDATAMNYNPQATLSDSSCIFLFGCTDPTALNYINALMDDGSCLYPINGCMDSLACNYNSFAVIDDGSCLTIYGCNDSTAFNYDPTANCNDGSCIAIIYGCTDPLGLNYYPGANINDPNNPCCYVSGCTDPTAFNYDPTACIDDGSCIPCVWGCTDISFSNYDSLATCDDGSCIVDVYGCTGPSYCNYDPLATVDDGSCAGMTGCTDPLYVEYNATASCDDGSCLTLISTSCTNPFPSNMFVSELINDRARINWDNMNDANCMVQQYRIRYREVGTSSWSSKTMSGSGLCIFGLNTTSKKILGLTPSTTYEYYMKAWYCGTVTSAWSAIQNFTTADECKNVINFVVSTPTTTKATFVWDTTAAYSFARIKLRVDTTGGVWTTAGGFGVMYPALSKSKNGLTPGQTYRASARTWCDPTGGTYRADSWTSPIFWTQPTSVRLEGVSAINNLSIYPNPSRDIFNVSFTSDAKQDLSIRILNVIGEELVSEDLEQFIGEYTKQIKLSDNAKGIYFLEIETNNEIINKKLILQ